MALPEDPFTPRAGGRLPQPAAGPAQAGTWPPHPGRPGIWKRSKALRVSAYVLGGLTALRVVLPNDDPAAKAPVAAAAASASPSTFASPSPVRSPSPSPVPSPSPTYDGLSVLPVAAGVVAGSEGDDDRDSTGRLLLVSGLLAQAANGDGDSWKDTAGREYRLGLVNAPELNECWGPEAHQRRRSLLSEGFRVRAGSAVLPDSVVDQHT